MPGMKQSRKRTRRRPRSGAAIHRNPAATPMTENKPIRGMKLKNVARLMMLFALLCLAAFVAGRLPVVAGGFAAAHAKMVRPAGRELGARRRNSGSKRVLTRSRRWREIE